MTRLVTQAIGVIAVFFAVAAHAADEARPPIVAPLPPNVGVPEAGPVSIPPSDIKRDPFRPFTLDVKAVQREAPRTPLEQYDIGALKLVAVIQSATNPKAMVENATGLGFTIQIGTRIGRNGGVVRKIEPDQVIVEEEFVDFYNQKKKTEVVMKLQPEGEKKP